MTSLDKIALVGLGYGLAVIVQQRGILEGVFTAGVMLAFHGLWLAIGRLYERGWI